MNESRPPREVRRDYSDRPPPQSSGLRVVAIVLGILGVVGFCAIASIVSFLAWIFIEARSAIKKSFAQAQANMAAASKQADQSANYQKIAMAIQRYVDDKGHYPPVSMKTKSGKPGLSWRVAILPYLDEDGLYRQFKTDEPWDHADNLSLARRMPAVFGGVQFDKMDHTHVRVFSGRGALFDPTLTSPIKLSQVKDGVTNTILIVESTDTVLWIEPKELEYKATGALPRLGLPNSDSFTVALADGSTKSVKKSTLPEKIRAAITPNGAEIISLD